MGYVHPFDNVPDPSRAGDAAAYPLRASSRAIRSACPIDVALGKVDFYEAVGLSDHRATNAVWYRLLNCGFRIPAGAGTDAMTNYASLRGPVGPQPRVREDRRAARLRPLPRRDSRPGRSMATNGPLVELALRPRGSSGAWSEPGDELALPAGRHALEARVSLRSIVPVDHLEIVRATARWWRTLPARRRPHRRRDATVSLPPLRPRAGTWRAPTATARATRCSTSTRSARRARST